MNDNDVMSFQQAEQAIIQNCVDSLLKMPGHSPGSVAYALRGTADTLNFQEQDQQRAEANRQRIAVRQHYEVHVRELCRGIDPALVDKLVSLVSSLVDPPDQLPF
jgi:hypothetical protein